MLHVWEAAVQRDWMKTTSGDWWVLWLFDCAVSVYVSIRAQIVEYGCRKKKSAYWSRQGGGSHLGGVRNADTTIQRLQGPSWLKAREQTVYWKAWRSKKARGSDGRRGSRLGHGGHSWTHWHQEEKMWVALSTGGRGREGKECTKTGERRESWECAVKLHTACGEQVINKVNK